MTSNKRSASASPSTSAVGRNTRRRLSSPEEGELEAENDNANDNGNQSPHRSIQSHNSSAGRPSSPSDTPRPSAYKTKVPFPFKPKKSAAPANDMDGGKREKEKVVYQRPTDDGDWHDQVHGPERTHENGRGYEKKESYQRRGDRYEPSRGIDHWEPSNDHSRRHNSSNRYSPPQRYIQRDRDRSLTPLGSPRHQLPRRPAPDLPYVPPRREGYQHWEPERDRKRRYEPYDRYRDRNRERNTYRERDNDRRNGSYRPASPPSHSHPPRSPSPPPISNTLSHPPPPVSEPPTGSRSPPPPPSESLPPSRAAIPLPPKPVASLDSNFSPPSTTKPTVSEPRSEPPPKLETQTKPPLPRKPRAMKDSVKIAPPASTKVSKPLPRRRTHSQERAAYGRDFDFIGCGKISDYDISAKLGEGTFGEVHRALQRSTKRNVALKRIFMHNEKEGMPITALREIKILKALNHPCIVQLLDMIIVPGDGPPKIYMVFPYMDHDLAGLLENEKVKFSPSQIKLYLKQLLEGTEYLHRNQILHRDMKAANLLINNEGVLQIADFGLARPFTAQRDPPFPFNNSKRRPDRYTNCVVTRWYRPPELLLGARTYGGEVDMWGVGCVLGEMFHRRPILQGDTDIDQLTKIWQLCGTATNETWPGWEELPGCEGVKKFVIYPRRLKDKYSELGDDTVDLLDKLLTLDPKKRITATDALDHDYFWTDPLPANPKTLPTYESSHEFDRTRQKQARRPIAAAPQRPPQNHQLPQPLHSRPQPFQDSSRPYAQEWKDWRQTNPPPTTNHVYGGLNSHPPHPQPPFPNPHPDHWRDRNWRPGGPPGPGPPPQFHGKPPFAAAHPGTLPSRPEWNRGPPGPPPPGRIPVPLGTRGNMNRRGPMGLPPRPFGQQMGRGVNTGGGGTGELPYG